MQEMIQEEDEEDYFNISAFCSILNYVFNFPRHHAPEPS